MREGQLPPSLKVSPKLVGESRPSLGNNSRPLTPVKPSSLHSWTYTPKLLWKPPESPQKPSKTLPPSGGALSETRPTGDQIR